MVARGLVFAGRVQLRGFRVQLAELCSRSRSGMCGRQFDRDGGGLESAGIEKAVAGVSDGGKRGGDDGGCTRGDIPYCNVN